MGIIVINIGIVWDGVYVYEIYLIKMYKVIIVKYFFCKFKNKSWIIYFLLDVNVYKMSK